MAQNENIRPGKQILQIKIKTCLRATRAFRHLQSAL
jgi:hypothetical protein